MRHTVCPGDTLYRIAIQYCVLPEDIVELNGLSSVGEVIVPGQELITPVEVGSELHVEVVPYPAQADGSIVHIVGNGQTLSEIAEAYGIGISELMRLNNLSSEIILPGQSLKIRA